MGGEPDDKIIAVLENDPFLSHGSVLPDLPPALIERLRHYFLTYKLVPGQPSEISIGEAYGPEPRGDRDPGSHRRLRG